MFKFISFIFLCLWLQVPLNSLAMVSEEFDPAEAQPAAIQPPKHGPVMIELETSTEEPEPAAPEAPVTSVKDLLDILAYDDVPDPQWFVFSSALDSISLRNSNASSKLMKTISLKEAFDLACALLNNRTYVKEMLVTHSQTLARDGIYVESTFQGHIPEIFRPLLIDALKSKEKLDHLKLIKAMLIVTHRKNIMPYYPDLFSAVKLNLSKERQESFYKLMFQYHPRLLPKSRLWKYKSSAARSLSRADGPLDVPTINEMSSLVALPSIISKKSMVEKILSRLNGLITSAEFQANPDHGKLLKAVKRCLLNWNASDLLRHKSVVFKWFEIEPTLATTYLRSDAGQKVSRKEIEDIFKPLVASSVFKTERNLSKLPKYILQLMNRIDVLTYADLRLIKEFLLGKGKLALGLYDVCGLFREITHHVDLKDRMAQLVIKSWAADKKIPDLVRASIADCVVSNSDEDFDNIDLIHKGPGLIRSMAMMGYLNSRRFNYKKSESVIQVVAELVKSAAQPEAYTVSLAEALFEWFQKAPKGHIPRLDETQVTAMATVIPMFEDEDYRDEYKEYILNHAASGFDAKAIVDKATTKAVLEDGGLYTHNEAVEDPEIIRSVGLSINKLSKTALPKGQTDDKAFAQCRKALEGLGADKKALQGLRNLQVSPDKFTEFLHEGESRKPRTFNTRQIFHWVWTRIKEIGCKAGGDVKLKKLAGESDLAYAKRMATKRKEASNGILKVLEGQLCHFVDRCSRGHITGLIETLDGFDEDVTLKISYQRELFQTTKNRLFKRINDAYSVAETKEDKGSVDYIDQLWESLATKVSQRNAKAKEVVDSFKVKYSDLLKDVYAGLSKEYVPAVVKTEPEFKAAFDAVVQQFYALAGE